MKFKPLLLIGACFSLMAVILGAFGAHAFADILTTKQMTTYETAVKYQFYHSQSIIIASILCYLFPNNRFFRWAGYLFVVGTLLFSGSLFAYLATAIKPFVFITPIGGLFFIIAWIVLIIGIMKLKTKKYTSTNLQRPS